MDELHYIKQVAILNGYTVAMIERTSRSIRRSDITTLGTQSEEKRRICLHFMPSITNKLEKVFNAHNMDSVYTTSSKLKQLIGSNKDRTPENMKAGIYSISCNDCDEMYIGQTKRCISVRFNEHLDKRRAVKSAVGTHIADTASMKTI